MLKYVIKIFHYEDYYSCKYGCDMFKEYNTCDCSNHYKGYKYSSLFKGKKFELEKCNLGCSYAIKSYIYPNYTLVENMIGSTGTDIISYHEDCGNNCYEDLMDHCDRNEECISFSIEKNHEGYCHNTTYHESNLNNNLIVKNSFLNNIYTTTSTL